MGTYLLEKIAGNWQESNGFANGIKIMSISAYRPVGGGQGQYVMTNNCSAWTDGYIYGEKRYRGEFDQNDVTPRW